MPEIGETLREARMRARIDVSEIEAKTKIRAKYLRALENEEWGLLPGPTFVKSFLRTYAQALGLDGKALVEAYRVDHEGPGDAAVEPMVSGAPRGRAPGPGRPAGGPSRAYIALIGGVILVIILLVVGLVSGGGSSKHTTSSSAASRAAKHKRSHAHRTSGTASSQPALVALSLRPTSTVYVCLIGDNGHKLIPGVDLQPGSSTPTYHARRFEITLGNNAVTMLVDGQARTVPPSSQAIAYSITKAFGRRPLHPGPTCV